MIFFSFTARHHSLVGNIGAELKGKTRAVAFFFTTVKTISVDTSRFCAALEVMETQLQRVKEITS